MNAKTCNLGVGCDETGTCYANANGRPEMCGQHAVTTNPQAAQLKRYDITAVYGPFDTIEINKEESLEGDWCKYAEAAERIATLERENSLMRLTLEVIVVDPIFDSYTQRLIRARKAAADTLNHVRDAARSGERGDETT